MRDERVGRGVYALWIPTMTMVNIVVVVVSRSPVGVARRLYH
jgi:hypothetical protein